MDKNQLKVQALLERITEITTQYENRCADYRVEITTLSEELKNLATEIERLNGELVQANEVNPADSPE